MLASADNGQAECDSQTAVNQRVLTKQHLYSILEERFYDKSAFIRQRVCKIWTSLVEAGPGYVHIGLWKKQLPELAMERLDDKPMVVKQAVALLSALLANHCFKIDKDSAVDYLDLERFKVMLALAQQHLEALEGEPASEQENHDANQQQAAGWHQDGPNDAEVGADIDEDQLDVHMDDQEGLGCPTPARASSMTRSAATARVELRPKTPASGGGLTFIKQSIASLSAAVEFTEVYTNAMPKLKQLLTTQSADVVKEVIKLMSMCKLLKVPGAAEALRAMWGLVFSTEEDVRVAVVEAWKDLYLTPGSGSSGSYDEVAESLIHQLDGCNDGEIQAAAKIMQDVASEGGLSVRLFNALMMKVDQLHCMAVQVTEDGNGVEMELGPLRAAFMLLSMWAPAAQDWLIKANELRLILKVGFCETLNDAWLVRHACIVLQHLAPHLSRNEACVEDDYSKRNCKMLVNQLLLRLTKVLVASQLPEQNWYSAAQAALQGLFCLHPKPNHFLAKILQTMEATIKKPTVSAVALSRFVFVLSHTCLMLLVFVDDLARKVKMHRSNQGRRMAEVQNTEGQADIEAELGAGSAAADLELDMLKEHVEAEILNCNYILGGHAKFLAEFLRQNYINGQFATMHPELRQGASLALTKLMVIDRHFCENNVALLFSILAHENFGSSVRCNILIALGDLNVRFPNSLEPWTEKMYEPLAGSDLEVKKTCVTVLTFLLLNDMIKVKGHIYKLALLLRDPDEEVRRIATRFWDELSKKAHHGQNPIFNLLLDIISNLSNVDTLSSDDFDYIMTFLLDKVQNDKHVDHLKERFCMRLDAIHDDQHQWHRLMICLRKLKYTEKGTRRVMELLKYYKHTFVDKEMVEDFKKLSDKLRKNSDKKPGLKQIADDYDQEVDAIVKSLLGDDEQAHDPTMQDQVGGPIQPKEDDEAGASDAVAAVPQPSSRKATGNRARQKAATASTKKVANTRASRRTKPAPAQQSSEDESDEESQGTQDSIEDSSDEERSNTQASRHRNRNGTQTKPMEQLSQSIGSLNLQPARAQTASRQAKGRSQAAIVPKIESDEEMQDCSD